jgi:hypothetical protein
MPHFKVVRKAGEKASGIPMAAPIAVMKAGWKSIFSKMGGFHLKTCEKE